MQAFPTLTEKFEDFIWAASKGAHRLVPWLKTLADEDRMKYLFELFAKFVVENHAEELTQYRCADFDTGWQASCLYTDALVQTQSPTRIDHDFSEVCNHTT